MSGDSFHISGDNVNMYGGTGNTGMVKNTVPAALSPEQRDAIRALTEQLPALRAQVSAADARTIDTSLPVLDPDAVVPFQDRRRALMDIALVATAAGTVGTQIRDAVTAILQLLGAQ
ncbi:hypothetical protein [Streptomyces sp. JW3]|uniref:hypothetical protein n=1 Tax=Streptomyces sp. JW3 TaxID=3456955 RepID=UPI003FA4D1CB